MRRWACRAGLVVAIWSTIGTGAAFASSWSIQSTPNPTGARSAQLNGISCVTATACVAVGTYTSSAGKQLTLAERWNGITWRLLRTFDPERATSSQLEGVSCVRVSLCVAVGWYANAHGLQRTLVERLRGDTWRWQPSANVSDTVGSELFGVSCTTGDACTAVGTNFGTVETLAERWNGVRWQIQPTPAPPVYNVAELYSVSCTSSTFCMASGQDQEQLTESWNGSTWTVQPNQGPTFGPFLGVTCKSASACETVGYAFAGPAVFATANSWDGTAFTDQPSASPGTSDSVLNAVSCTTLSVPGPAGCEAVGGAGHGPNPLSAPESASAESFDGTTWTLQSVPSPAGTTFSVLNGVSCADGTCIAVGTYGTSAQPGPQFTLAENFS
ncbi:MAG: hypothetical protein QOG14_2555 [Mycobacterium sp.]|nr:hypothetical protein [Mycobacterium sp.]